MDAWNKNKWYDIVSEVLPFKITDTDNVIFFIKPPLPMEEETAGWNNSQCSYSGEESKPYQQHIKLCLP